MRKEHDVHTIDLNADLGESLGSWRMGDDAAMLDVVSSANVACGFHAGDPAGILTTLRAAADRDVAVGAHPGYRDLVGFGRRAMDIASDDLRADVIYQIGALRGLARAAGTTVRYVKPHGALYNTIARDERQARDVVEAVLAVDPELTLMGLAGSVVIEVAEAAGLSTVTEAFVDRGYEPDGSLVNRRSPGAVLHDPDAAADRLVRLATEGVMTAVDGSEIRIDAQSVCVHGDSPAAVEMATRARTALEAAGVRIASFTGAAS